MNHNILILLLLITISLSCREVYDPDISTDQSVLVVEGVITDQPGPYTIHLTQALPYDSANIYIAQNAISKANVFVTDDLGNKFKFTESEAGYFISKASEFTGTPGVTYTLHIQTLDGNTYESAPQKMPSNNYSDTVYTEYSSKEIFNGKEKVTTSGMYVLTDITDNTDSLLRFRFKTTMYSYWFFIVSPPRSDLGEAYLYYGWYTTYPNGNINLTQGKYNTSVNNVQKQIIYFMPTEPEYYIATLRIPPYFASRDSFFNLLPVKFRTIKIEQYRINEKTYQYNENINTSISAEGKIFDPIVLQLKGNITCSSNPSKLALGFFEASSLRIKTYTCDIGVWPRTLIKQPNIWPATEKGYLMGEWDKIYPPPFWPVYYKETLSIVKK